MKRKEFRMKLKEVDRNVVKNTTTIIYTNMEGKCLYNFYNKAKRREMKLSQM